MRNQMRENINIVKNVFLSLGIITNILLVSCGGGGSDDTTPTSHLTTSTDTGTSSNDISVSSTSSVKNTLSIAWDYDLSTNPYVIGFNVYDSQGALLCSTDNLQEMKIDCVYDSTLPAETFTMTAYDSSGNESAPSAPFVANKAPVASIDAQGNSIVKFDASGSYDFDGGTIDSYKWNFGDGTTATSATVLHTFQPGIYTVTLEVTDNEGAVTSTQVNFEIA